MSYFYRKEVLISIHLNDECIADAIVKGLVGEKSNAISSINTGVGNSGHYNNWVRRLQEECNRQGFSNQVVDGITGLNTLAGCPTLKYGARGEIIRLIQGRLVELGYNTNDVDGIFGNGTLSAIKKLQEDKKLFNFGVVGKNTWMFI